MLFEPGSFGATRGGGPVGRASKALVQPETDRFHFFMIFLYIPELNDYIIIESLNIGLFAKGITFGWLSKYKGKDVEIYSISDPEIAAYGEHACYRLIEFGAAPYDFMLIPQLALSGLRAALKILVAERRLRPIKPEELSYVRNSKFICTECVAEGWASLGYWIIPYGVAPVPAGFRQAEIENRIQRDYKGDLRDILG